MKRKYKYKIITEKGEVIEKYMRKFTAFSDLPRLRKIYVGCILEVKKIE